MRIRTKKESEPALVTYTGYGRTIWFLIHVENNCVRFSLKDQSRAYRSNCCGHLTAHNCFAFAHINSTNFDVELTYRIKLEIKFGQVCVSQLELVDGAIRQKQSGLMKTDGAILQQDRYHRPHIKSGWEHYDALELETFDPPTVLTSGHSRPPTVT